MTGPILQTEKRRVGELKVRERGQARAGIQAPAILRWYSHLNHCFSVPNPGRRNLCSGSHLQLVQNRTLIITSFLLFCGSFQPLLLAGFGNIFPMLTLRLLLVKQRPSKSFDLLSQELFSLSLIICPGLPPHWRGGDGNGTKPDASTLFLPLEECLCSDRCPYTGWFLLPPGIIAPSIRELLICSNSQPPGRD